MPAGHVSFTSTPAPGYVYHVSESFCDGTASNLQSALFDVHSAWVVQANPHINAAHCGLGALQPTAAHGQASPSPTSYNPCLVHTGHMTPLPAPHILSISSQNSRMKEVAFNLSSSHPFPFTCLRSPRAVMTMVSDE